jgi:hypothetical protein
MDESLRIPLRYHIRRLNLPCFLTLPLEVAFVHKTERRPSQGCI